MAAGAALALLLTLLCDYYYFTYAVLIAAVAVLWHSVQARDWRWWARRGSRGPLALCGALGLILCGPLVGALALLSASGSLTGVHEAEDFSLDLLAIVVPGGHWRFASLTASYWTRLPGNIHESSVGIGIGAIVAAGYALARRREHCSAGAGFWAAIGLGGFLWRSGRWRASGDTLCRFRPR